MRPKNQNIFFWLFPRWPDTARRQVSDTSTYRKTLWMTGRRAPLGDKGTQDGWKTSARRMQQRHVLKPCSSDWILRSELETGSVLPSLFQPHIFISQNAHWRSSMKSTGKRIEKANVNDQNHNICTESWAACGDYESIYKSQRLLVTLEDIFFLLNREGGFGRP